MVKRLRQKNHVPYRPLEFDLLGSISPPKPTRKESENDNEETHNPRIDKDGFISPRKSTRRNNIIEKEIIFERIRSVIDGFNLIKKLEGAHKPLREELKIDLPKKDPICFKYGLDMILKIDTSWICPL